jgi:hypothetical protein
LELELEKAKAQYAGKPMLIVGNGPSLNGTPLDGFANVNSIGMNKIDLIFDRVKWRPSFIVCTNNLVVKQHSQTMVQHGIPCYLSWKSRWFIPLSLRKNFTFFLNETDSDFRRSVVDGVGVSGTVTYTALQLAHHLGANPVVLVGVDHSFSTTGNANEIQKREGDDPNHFDPNYFADGQYWGVPNLPMSEVGYHNARREFEKDGRRVYDATVGGKLEVFDKISIEEALALCNNNP